MKKVATKATSNSQVVNYIVKKALQEYELVEAVIEDDTVVSRKVLATDIPMIIMGKLVRLMKEQKVETK